MEVVCAARVMAASEGNFDLVKGNDTVAKCLSELATGS